MKKTTTTSFTNNQSSKFPTPLEVFKKNEAATKVIKEVKTNVFMILDEDRMEIVNQTFGFEYGSFFHNEKPTPMLFATKKEANEFAAGKLEIWDIVNSKFNHKFIQHKQNTQPEVVKVETGRMIDTDNQVLNVKIRFGKWLMDFGWTINTKTNWVHTDNDPTHLDGMEIEEIVCDAIVEDNRSQQITKDAHIILNHFDFEDAVVGKEIEDRKHMIE
tara:strand:+ start:1200 stop:1847 length:648 start_codon:yes stop_codon:yes gene_type:complete